MEPFTVDEDGKVFISESKLGRLYVYFEEYKNDNFLHIRYWFNCKKEGIYKPGLKGIAIPEANVRTILQALKIVLGSANEKPAAPVEEDPVSIYA